jgi:hypothetical protein
MFKKFPRVSISRRLFWESGQNLVETSGKLKSKETLSKVHWEKCDLNLRKPGENRILNITLALE